MNFVFKMMGFALEMVNFVFKIMDFALKGCEAHARQSGWSVFI